MNDQKPKRIPEFPMEDSRSVGFHVAMGTLDAAASIIPGGGYGVQQLVKQFIGEPLERRREQWFTAVGEGLRELQDRLDGFDPDQLGQNDEFVSVVAATTRIALATHQTEKLEVLRNVVLNAAIGVKVDDYLRGAFLEYIDRFSALHIKIMKILENPSAFPSVLKFITPNVKSSWAQILIYAIPEVKRDENTIVRVLYDLGQSGLTSGNLRSPTTTDGLIENKLTDFGNEFLRFISDPLAS